MTGLKECEKMKKTAQFMLLIVFLSISSITRSSDFTQDFSLSKDAKDCGVNFPSSWGHTSKINQLVSRDPIYINDDSAFTSANGVSAGTGTEC